MRLTAIGGRWNVVGSSCGGYLAALLAQERPDLVNRIVLLAPSFDDFNGWLGAMQRANPQWGDGPGQVRTADMPPPQGPYNGVDESGGLDYAYVLDHRRWPPFPLVQCPAVVVHALDDADVDVSHSLAWVKRHKSLPVTLHVLPTLDPAQQLDHGLYHFAKPDADTQPTLRDVLLRHFR
eukprot:COSAG01_NODE_15249_length_1357_cov_3.207472_1_plen_179_part_00